MFKIKIHEDALQELKALPASLQGKMVRQINKLSEFGTLLREPDTKAITNGFFELRAKAGDIGRAIYVYRYGKKIYILKIFAKSTAKLPSAILTSAAKRLEEMLNDE
ncbi:TPA: type II toxin-antitoxin system RelE/ParE family toxin [Providencia rettgeri]|nr:type II toxin-antitoxin system RelE/ParE family toxin [Providencia rettgeri]